MQQEFPYADMGNVNMNILPPDWWPKISLRVIIFNFSEPSMALASLTLQYWSIC